VLTNGEESDSQQSLELEGGTIKAHRLLTFLWLSLAEKANSS
jgi:hypothetical protein